VWPQGQCLGLSGGNGRFILYPLDQAKNPPKAEPKFWVSDFSVPRYRFASDGISASLQQVLVFIAFLTPGN